MNFESKLFFL